LYCTDIAPDAQFLSGGGNEVGEPREQKQASSSQGRSATAILSQRRSRLIGLGGDIEWSVRFPGR
jgi:hypothetical protein